MTPERLAALHARSFSVTPRPWTAAEFADMLGLPGHRLAFDDPAFALWRQVGPEAELLTLAVPPEMRRQGRGARLLRRLEEAAEAAGAESLLLEVAETNLPARALYEKAGYRPAGWRKDYYRAPCGPRIAALVLQKALR
ncbi:MAG: GNAT family N-acetyltransferase [Pseudomonadota bacterium]